MREALNDSAIALSALEPIRPIDWRTPSRLQVAWKAEEVYCRPWSEWNTAPRSEPRARAAFSRASSTRLVRM